MEFEFFKSVENTEIEDSGDSNPHLPTYLLLLFDLNPFQSQFLCLPHMTLKVIFNPTHIIKSMGTPQQTAGPACAPKLVSLNAWIMFNAFEWI